MARFFISYRREDGSGYAGRIYDHLVQSFGEDHVFMDVDAIEPGQDFVEVIQDAVGSCSALIAVIGRNWSGVRGDGSRRIDDPEDFVLLEVATALERGVRVIPILVDDAEAPKLTELPPRLQALARRNAVRATHTSFRVEIDRLVRTLAKLEAPTAASSPPSPPPAAASPKLSPRPIGPIEQARIRRLDIPQEVYHNIFLSPNGRDLYLSRWDEKVGSTALHFDMEAEDLYELATFGWYGAYFIGFMGDLFYIAPWDKTYKAQKILCFRSRKSVPYPLGKRGIQHLNIVSGKKLIFWERGHCYEWEPLVERPHRLNLGEGSPWVVWSHPRKPIFLAGFHQRSGPVVGKDPLYEFHLVELDPRHEIKSSNCVLTESETHRYRGFTSWTDEVLLFEERFDSNGDGTVDDKDERNELVHALDLRTGVTSPVLPEPGRRRGLGGHPSGRYVYSFEEIAKNETYVLRMVDVRASSSTDLVVLNGGKYQDCQFDEAFRFAICRQVGTTGWKKFFSRKDRSSIYRIDLPTLS